MQSPTIAQLKAQAPESLWHFLLSLPTSMEAQIWYALTLGAVLGMVGHYIRARVNGSISGSPVDYFFRDNLWRSIGAAIAVMGELVAEITSGLFFTDAGLFVGWAIVILSGIKTGYLGDSLVNKGQRVIWTEEQRESAGAKNAGEPPR